VATRDPETGSDSIHYAIEVLEGSVPPSSGAAPCSSIRWGDHSLRSRWQKSDDATGGGEGCRMFVLQIFVLLILVGAALWLIPMFLSRSARKMPSKVPQAWVEKYRTDERGSG